MKLLASSYSLILACPVKFLPRSTILLLLFNQGFEEDELSLPRETRPYSFNSCEFNRGFPTSYACLYCSYLGKSTSCCSQGSVV